jgi:hypothetical protein
MKNKKFTNIPRWEQLRDMILSYNFYPQDEKELQDKIEEIFKNEKVKYEREYRLSNKDIPDFMVDGCIAAEVKIAGGMDIHRQLLRYAQHQSVKELLLISTKDIMLPPQLNNKDVNKIIIYTFL